MVPTSGRIPSLAVLFLFTYSTSASPATPIPHKTLAFRQPTASPGSSQSADLSVSSGLIIQSSNASNSSPPPPTSTPEIDFTQTVGGGLIEGCITVDTETYSHWISGEFVATESPFCAPGVSNIVDLSTDGWDRSAYNSLVSSLAPVSAPHKGCAIGTDHVDGGNTQYCTCAGSGTLSASRVSTMLGYSNGPSTDLTTVCNTGPGSLPTDYVEVPAVTDTNTDQLWAQTPSVLTAGYCTNGSTPTAECWERLDMEEYVNWWWGAFNSTCDREGYGSSFGYCFLKLMSQDDSTNCSVIQDNPPCYEPQWKSYQDKWNGLRNWYVHFNLYSMNNFLLNYWTALKGAETTASDVLGSIIERVDPTHKTNVGLGNILMALSTGLAFVTVSPWVEVPEVALMAQTVITAAQQLPAIAKFLFPEGTADSQLLEMSDISAKLAGVVKTLQDNIGQACSIMVDDIGNFTVSAASNGGSFSGYTPGIAVIQSNILTGLYTYLISQAYQENGVFISRQLNTSVYDLMHNGTDLAYPLPCTTGYTDGICDTFWFDSTDSTTYAFTPGDVTNRTANYNSDMMDWFITNNYTRPELIFRGAMQCADASHSNQGSSTPLIRSATEFNTDCLSNMRVCTWSLTPGTNAADGSIAAYDPLFSDCSDEEVFGHNTAENGDICPNYETCSRGSCASKGMYFRAFRQYLGWGIQKDAGKDNGVFFCAGDKK